jgi:hypothetical protein
MLESKGFEDAQDSAKHQAVQRWVAGIIEGSRAHGPFMYATIRRCYTPHGII